MGKNRKSLLCLSVVCTVEVWAGVGAVQLQMAGSARLFAASRRRRRPASAVHRSSSRRWRPAGRRSGTSRTERPGQQRPAASAARRTQITSQLVVAAATWRHRTAGDVSDDVTRVGLLSTLRHGTGQWWRQQPVSSSMYCRRTVSRWRQTVRRLLQRSSYTITLVQYFAGLWVV